MQFVLPRFCRFRPLTSQIPRTFRRMEPVEARRRMRAARVLAGLTVPKLAERIPDENRMGERTLRKLESGESELRPKEMREIAEACDLPYEFFTVDFSRLPELNEGAGDLAGRMDELEAELAEVRELLQVPHHGSTPPDERAAEIAEAAARSAREQHRAGDTKAPAGRPGRRG